MMLYQMLCNGVKREGVKAILDLASGLFCNVPFHNIRYGIMYDNWPAFYDNATLSTG
jgi:hypothetical protein